MALINKYMKLFLRILPFLVVILLSIYLYFYGSSDDIISYIGLENAYALMFSFALIGGLTTFNTVPYYSLLLLLAAAGVDPFFLGLSSALGVMGGDTFSYFMGYSGGAVIPEFLKKYLEMVRVFAVNYPKLFLILCFVYGSISPLSNDLITIPGGMARISYLKVMIPLGLGNIVFNITLCYLIVYANAFVLSFI
jgi:membrane protein YqaA with SNARE-associated domain